MVRLNWQYQIRSKKDLCVSAIVTLVPVDFEKSKL
jgi:acyl-CoA thioester hydrolase